MRIDKAKVWFNIYRCCRWISWGLEIAFLLLNLCIVGYFICFFFPVEHIIYKKINEIVSGFIDNILTFLGDDIINIYWSIIFIVILLFLWNYLLNMSLSQNIREWSRQQDWTYDNRNKNYEVCERYDFLNKLLVGENRYAFDYIRGTWNGLEAEAFNFHYQEQKGWFNTSNNYGCYLGYFGSSTSYSSSSGSYPKINHYYLGVVILKLNPQLDFLSYYRLIEIRQQKILDNFTLNFFRNNDDFSLYGNRLIVKCDNKELQESFCNSNLIDYLLERKNIDIHIHLFKDYLIFYKNRGKMNCYEIEKFLNILTEVIRLGIGNCSESSC